MSTWRRVISVLIVAEILATPMIAQEPAWSGRVVTSGAERTRIQATPIELRPYRPFHFYGNAVRRQHYRGTLLPAPRDFVNGATALLRGE